jgi:Ca2+:H+ antiporter
VNILWPFAIVAIVLQFATDAHLWIFAAAYVGMIPAANLLGFAGQEFARKMPKVAGILIEVSFGSIVEIILFVVLIIKHENGTADGTDNGDEGNLIPIIQVPEPDASVTSHILTLPIGRYPGLHPD